MSDDDKIICFGNETLLFILYYSIDIFLKILIYLNQNVNV